MYSLCFSLHWPLKHLLFSPLLTESSQAPYQLETILLFSYTSLIQKSHDNLKDKMPFIGTYQMPGSVWSFSLNPHNASCGPILQMRKWELWEVKQLAQVCTGSQLRDQDSNPDLLMLNPMFFPVYHVNSSIPVKHTVALLSTCCSLTSYLT